MKLPLPLGHLIIPTRSYYMISSTRVKALAGIGGVAALVAFTASPAFAFGVDTGNEAITAPVTIAPGVTVETTASYTPTNDANGNPIGQDLTISGSGYDPAGGSITAEVCDGVPETSPKFVVTQDCDDETATGFVGVGVNPATGAELPSGDFSLVGGPAADNFSFTVGLFRGVGPSDFFNCLAPNDNPTSTSVTVPNANANLANPAATLPFFVGDWNSSTQPYGVAAIDPTVPSWGTNLPGADGVTASPTPCMVRVAYTNTTKDLTSDHEFPITLSQDAVPLAGAPGTEVPESPLAIALPVGGVVLFGAAGAVLYRKRRSNSASA
jgi:hypothetical protein